MLMPVPDELWCWDDEQRLIFHGLVRNLWLEKGGTTKVQVGETITLKLDMLHQDVKDWLVEQRCGAEFLGVYDGVVFHMYLDLPEDHALLWKLRWL